MSESRQAAGVPDPGYWSGHRVVVTGGGGFLGRHVVALLGELGASVSAPASREFDLRDRGAAATALAGAETVIHLAATVGGIGFNRRNPGPLLSDNLAMGVNVFEAARLGRVGRLLSACSVCAYPHSPPRIPFVEEDIWAGEPEPSNAPYGIAKRVLASLSAAYRRQYGMDSCVPVLTNLYGPGDSFDPDDAHVVPAMIGKYMAAAASGSPSVTLWGTGRPTRDFLYVEDAARAIVLMAERCDSSDPVNLASGTETSVRDLAAAVASAAGFEGETVWDESQPDGQPRRVLDTSRARALLGFEPEVELGEGLRRTVEGRLGELAAAT